MGDHIKYDSITGEYIGDSKRCAVCGHRHGQHRTLDFACPTDVDKYDHWGNTSFEDQG